MGHNLPPRRKVTHKSDQTSDSPVAEYLFARSLPNRLSPDPHPYPTRTSTRAVLFKTYSDNF